MQRRSILILLGLLFLSLGPLCRNASAQTSSVTINTPTNGQTVSGTFVYISASYTLAPNVQTGSGASLCLTNSTGQTWYLDMHSNHITGGGVTVGAFDSTSMLNGSYTLVVDLPALTSTSGYQYVLSPPVTVNVRN